MLTQAHTRPRDPTVATTPRVVPPSAWISDAALVVLRARCLSATLRCTVGRCCVRCGSSNLDAQLVLEYNKIGNAGAAALAKALETNRTLTEVCGTCKNNGCRM